ncbi:hypothetical protein E4U91_36880 [Streptomyces lasalocidi]|uniref:Uncharacterized protein n=1 Tax=Streptomyces lasalocidi TaxID=324833 RepID=A0A4U5W4B5_STRLS|nr:hypothetical protein E4U91_36880 [Streptomyces lasalocidi]
MHLRDWNEAGGWQRLHEVLLAELDLLGRTGARHIRPPVRPRRQASGASSSAFARSPSAGAVGGEDTGRNAVTEAGGVVPLRILHRHFQEGQPPGIVDAGSGTAQGQRGTSLRGGATGSRRQSVSGGLRHALEASAAPLRVQPAPGDALPSGGASVV